MGLLSIFTKRKNDDAARPTAVAEAVAQARLKARHRLIGAVVLLGVGIIGFPLLFETQPRPIPVDIPIEIPGKENAAPLAVPAPRPPAAQRQHPKGVVITEAADEEMAPASAAATSATAVAKTEAASSPAKTHPTVATADAASPPPSAVASTPVKVASTAKPIASSTAGDGVRAQALLDGKNGAMAATADGRFIVQVGAYAEASAAKEARAKLEKLGLKTYTQAVETSSGRRIRVRVGPFGSRDQAVQAAEKIKSAGLPAAVLTL